MQSSQENTNENNSKVFTSAGKNFDNFRTVGNKGNVENNTYLLKNKNYEHAQSSIINEVIYILNTFK